MPQIASAVGIDCGKARLDVAVFPGGSRLQVANTPAGHEELLAWIAVQGLERIGLEASGGYERAVRDALSRSGLEVHTLNPARVRHYARAKGWRAKTDALDAVLIAEFTACLVDTPTAPIDKAREELAGMVRARRLLVDKRADLVKAVTHAPTAAKEAIDQAAASLAMVIDQLDAEIERQVRSAPDIQQTVKRLRSAPGIGPVSAVTLAALMPEMGHSSSGRIAALLGVAPFPDDSGERSGKRHIAGGRADVRRALYMATMVAATHTHGVIATFYRRLIDAGKRPKVAIVACMRKLIVRLNVMLAHNQTWSEQPAK